MDIYDFVKPVVLGLIKSQTSHIIMRGISATKENLLSCDRTITTSEFLVF